MTKSIDVRCQNKICKAVKDENLQFLEIFIQNLANLEKISEIHLQHQSSSNFRYRVSFFPF